MMVALRAVRSAAKWAAQTVGQMVVRTEKTLAA